MLPGSTHDITAARAHVLPGLGPYLTDLPVLAGSGYDGAGIGVHVPVKRPAGGGELDIDTRTRNALLRSLRYQGERGVAPMTQRWRCLQRVTLSPSKIGDIARSARVLVLSEHTMLTWTRQSDSARDEVPVPQFRGAASLGVEPAPAGVHDAVHATAL